MNKGIGIAILFGLGLLLFLVTRKTPVLASGCASCQPLRLMPSGSLAKQYVNEEKWDVTYNEDGLPTSVKITRYATET